jgi:hypothetical protein
MYSPLEMPDVPTITLTFVGNKSLPAVNPIVPLYDQQVCSFVGKGGKCGLNQLAESGGSFQGDLKYVILLKFLVVST